MIKLLNILAEIKFVNRVTWEMINDLWTEIVLLPRYGARISDEFVPILKKQGWDGRRESWLETLDQNQLSTLYVEMSSLIKKHKNINEIKFFNKTPRNDNELLPFLESNKQLVLEWLRKNDDSFWFEEEDDENKFWNTLNQTPFEMDGYDCPSIGDGIYYYSFSIEPKKMIYINGDGEEIERKEIEIRGAKFYYIGYSI